MKHSLVIVGTGGQGRVVADIARLCGAYETIVFADDDPAAAAPPGFALIGGRQAALERAGDHEVFVAIGRAMVRQALTAFFDDHGVIQPVLVHPRAVVAQDVVIGPGTVVMPGGIVNTGSVLGRGVIVNTAASADHDARLGDFVHLAVGAHLAGGVQVGARSWIGAGAVVIEGITIGPDVLVGAGAAVVRDLPAAGVYGGVPARPLVSRKGEPT